MCVKLYSVCLFKMIKITAVKALCSDPCPAVPKLTSELLSWSMIQSLRAGQKLKQCPTFLTEKESKTGGKSMIKCMNTFSQIHQVGLLTKIAFLCNAISCDAYFVTKLRPQFKFLNC